MPALSYKTIAKGRTFKWEEKEQVNIKPYRTTRQEIPLPSINCRSKNNERPKDKNLRAGKTLMVQTLNPKQQ
jgi:hypothetical protein